MHKSPYIPCKADEYHLLEVAELPPDDKNWSLFDIGALLRDGSYQELDKKLENAFATSFLNRDAERRYYFAWAPQPDLHDTISTGTEALAQIKAWQHSCPTSNHAWLAETLYWLHYAWRYRSHGWAKETTSAMWVCAAACNEMMILAALKALALDPRQWMAAALAISAFNVPDWFKLMIKGKLKRPISALDELRRYWESDPEEMDALMGYSGLNENMKNALPNELPTGMEYYQSDDPSAWRDFWLFTALRIHPSLFYILTEYIPFRMPRWGGSQEKMHQLISSPVCEHLNEQEKDHLRHLIWWDNFRDVDGYEIENLTERDRQFIEVQREAKQALNSDDRAQALRWLVVSCYELGDETSAWLYLQQLVAESPDLNPYLHRTALLLAEKFTVDPRWKHNFICHNAQYGQCPQAMVLKGSCLLTGLFGFAKNETLGRQWLEYSLKQDLNDAWESTIITLRKLGYQEEAQHLLVLGVEYGARGALAELARYYLYEQTPPDIPRAIDCCCQVIAQDTDLLNKRAAAQKYPLIDNYSVFSYEEELKVVYYWLARGYQLLSYEETDIAKIDELQQQLIAALKAASDWGSDKALSDLLLIISEVQSLDLTHQYLDFLLEHGYKGNLSAMISLAKIYYNRQDKKLYNYKTGARWMHFASTLAPDDDKVNEVLFSRYARNRWATYRYTWSTLRIPEHEIPKKDNLMV